MICVISFLRAMASGTRSRSVFRKVERSEYRVSEPFRTRVVEYVIHTKSDLEYETDRAGVSQPKRKRVKHEPRDYAEDDYGEEEEEENEFNEEMDDDVNVERDDEWGQDWVAKVIRQMIAQLEVHENLQPTDQLGIDIMGGDLDYAVRLPIRKYQSQEHQARALISAIQQIQQSKREWTLGARLELRVTVVKDFQASGKRGIRQAGMTPELLLDRLEASVLQCVRPNQSSNLTLDMFTILAMRSGKTINQVKEELNVADSARWEDVCIAWCQSHGETNIIVIGQSHPEDYHHSIYWKSVNCNPRQSWVVWFDEEDNRMLNVVAPDLLYGPRWKKKQCMCLKCGFMFSENYRAQHDCATVNSLYVRNKRKVNSKYHRPHYKCSDTEKALKLSRVKCAPENCLGQSLYTFFTQKGYELSTPETKSLKEWYEEMGMMETWDRACGMADVQAWVEALNREYNNPDDTEGELNRFEVAIYDEHHRTVIASFGPQQQPSLARVPGNTFNTVVCYLNLEQDHFTWVRSMTGWLGSSYFCTKCHKGYHHSEKHACNKFCARCGHPGENHYEPGWKQKHITCDSCHNTFFSIECYRYHKLPQHKNGLDFNTCDRMYQCTTCSMNVDRLKCKLVRGVRTYYLKDRESHTCYEYNCSICGEKEVIRGEHQCYVRGVGQVEEPDMNENRVMNLAFFDFETQCLEDHHKVNKVVVMLVCNECVDTIEQYAVQACTGLCGNRLKIFNTVSEFMDWLLANTQWLYHYVFLAHNLKGYDSYPILEECVRRAVKPECVYQGAKVMKMNIQGVNFKDSVCFIPMALRNFVSAFGISGGDKGYFPHFFNTSANEGYVGEYPALEYYGIEDMNPGEQRKLREWWNLQQGKQFNLAEELEKYCIQDVMVMLRGCLAFRKLYVTKFGVDPFSECLTIASTCLRVFKSNFLEPETLGVVAPMGYRSHDIQSVEAMEWLQWLGINDLRYAGHPDGEMVLMGAKVDGYDAATRTVYQYHGCWYHGCTVCFPKYHAINVHLGVSYGDLNNQTARRTAQLREGGYKVIEMWSHVWEHMKSQREIEFPEWIKNREPLMPRKGMSGGRTSAIGLYAITHEASEARGDEMTEVDAELMLVTPPCYRIRYIDVCSLYPHVMWEGEYPVGHPDIWFGDDMPPLEEFMEMLEEDFVFGLVLCDVDPPRGLYFPVLPVLMNHKLMFPLCYTCALEGTADHQETYFVQCEHTVEERRIRRGTWTTPELKLAVSKGYHIHAVHEVWHYEEQTQDLFRPYIQHNLKMKIEASGWPPYCTNEEEKRTFMRDVKNRQGVELEYDKVIKNPGLRSIAKLNLNCLWGKFGQNPFRDKVEYVTQPTRYFDLLNDDMINVKSVLLLSDDIVQVAYEHCRMGTRINSNGNVVVASFVPAYARMKLYEKLDVLQERVLYHDTDSIIYTSQEGEEEVEIGDCLGQWTDECGDSNTNWITEYVSLGPKTYAYKTHQGEMTVKCKGISLTPHARSLVHMESMKEMLVKKNKVTVDYPRKIVRNPNTKRLHTVEFAKDVQAVITKRMRVREGINTYPFGY